VRATGAVLLDLPGAIRKIAPAKSQVFFSNPRNPTPLAAWEFFKKAAEQNLRDPEELYDEVKVTQAELRSPVLPA
jgi:hypothetical protein